MENKVELIECDCHGNDHFVALRKIDWGEGYYDYTITVTAAGYKGFFGRLVWAFKYLFKVGNTYYDYREVILNDESVEKFEKFLEEYKRNKK